MLLGTTAAIFARTIWETSEDALYGFALYGFIGAVALRWVPALSICCVMGLGWRRLRGQRNAELRREIGLQSASTRSITVGVVLGALIPAAYHASLISLHALPRAPLTTFGG